MKRLLICFLFLIVTNFHLIEAIKYSITTSTNDVIHRDEDIIESVEGAERITIQEEFQTFDDDLLLIQHETPVFMMTKNRALNNLAKGAFVDQEITESIVIINSQIKIIPKNAFKNLKIFELILKDNEISHIDEEAITDMPNLHTVNLAENKLIQFHENSFVGAPVKFIDMAHNELEKIGENWFTFMSDEEPTTVLLDHNEIEKIDGSAFDGTMLGTLNLRANNLESLPSEIFESSGISRIYLQENHFENLPDSFFELNDLILANLKDNSLDCSTVSRLKKMDRETKAEIKVDDC